MTGKLIELDDHRKVWMTVKEKCPCGHSCIGVVHQDSDLNHLECARCGRMTSVATMVFADNDKFIVLHPKKGIE